MRLVSCRFSRFRAKFLISSHEACLQRPSRPFTCPGRLLVVTGWRPALHAGDARDQAFGILAAVPLGQGRSPCRSITLSLPPLIRPSRGRRRKSDANRSYARSRKPSGASCCPKHLLHVTRVTLGVLCAGRPTRSPADRPPPYSGGAGRKNQRILWKVTPGDRHKSRTPAKPSLVLGPLGRTAWPSASSTREFPLAGNVEGFAGFDGTPDLRGETEMNRDPVESRHRSWCSPLLMRSTASGSDDVVDETSAGADRGTNAQQTSKEG